MSNPVRLIPHGAVAVIEIDNLPVNAAGHGVRAGLIAAIAAAEADAAIRAIVIACAGRTFVAGADIREFGKPPVAPILTDAVSTIEAATKPVVAALHGTALGGGCEIALGAHARIMAADSRLGQPEVKLGIIPGAGGTQRLPRLIGVPAAIEIVATGRMIDASEALTLGLVDRIAGPDLLADAIAFAEEIAGQPPRRTGALPVPPFDRAGVETQIRDIDKKARGQTSPGEAARAVLMAADLALPEGLARERDICGRLIASSQAAALRHVFFAEREVAKVPGLDGVGPRAIATIGIAGAGTMGSGIAVAAADAGYRVIVVEQSEEAAARGRDRTAGLYDRSVKSGRITAAVKAERLARMSFAADVAAFAPCDLVIEAVFDDLAVKQALFRRLDAVLRPDAILATNTSYLDPDAIAAAVSHPDRVLGLHFFSPAHVMRLLEVVKAAKTSAETLATGLAVGRKLGKLAVVSGVCEGFIGNRIFASYRKQCEYMLEDGALPQEIDAAMEAYGFPMGPFAVFDLAGLDIAWARRQRLAPGRDPRERYVAIADALCERGRFGQKTGAGWYRYDGGRRAVDPEVTALIELASADKHIARRTIPAAEIQARILAAMANEGARILAEGVALRPLDIDLVFINGYGFPAWRGGPMYAADHAGLETILAQVERMQTRDGLGRDPAPLLADLAESGRRFEHLNRV